MTVPQFKHSKRSSCGWERFVWLPSIEMPQTGQRFIGDWAGEWTILGPSGSAIYFLERRVTQVSFGLLAKPVIDMCPCPSQGIFRDNNTIAVVKE